MTSAPQNDLERAIAAATGCGEQNIPFFRQLLKSKLTLLKPRPKDLVPRLKSADANLMEFAVWNSDGRQFIPVFSCAARASESVKTLRQQKEGFRFQQIDGKLLFESLAQQKNTLNVIVNPACSSGALELKEEHLEGLADGSILVPPTPGALALEKLIMFGSMHFPPTLVKVMPPLLAAHPEVRAAWLFRNEATPDPNEPEYDTDDADYVLGLLVTKGFTKELEAEIGRVANRAFQPPQRCQLWIMDPTDSALIDIMGEYPEFYAASGFVRCEFVPGRAANTGPARDLAKDAAAARAWEPRNELEQAMQASIVSPTANPEMFRQLRKCPITFISPYHPEMVGEHKIGDGTPVSFVVWKKEDEECVPVFTSEARLEEALRTTGNDDRNYCIADMPGAKLFEVMVAVKLKYKVVVNPGCVTGNVILDMNAVRMLADGSILKPIARGEMVRRSAEIVDAADYPTDFIQPVFEFLRGKPVAQAAWLFRQSPPPKTGETSYIIGLLTSDETGSELEQDLVVVAESVCPPKCSFGVAILDPKKPSMMNAMSHFQPFYASLNYHGPAVLPGEAGNP
jgi:hypothetical protein